MLDCRRKISLIFTNFIHDMCRWRLINVWNVQYHGLINLVGNQRNVTMTAYGKSIGWYLLACTQPVEYNRTAPLLVLVPNSRSRWLSTVMHVMKWLITCQLMRDSPGWRHKKCLPIDTGGPCMLCALKRDDLRHRVCVIVEGRRVGHMTRSSWEIGLVR